ncbi:hypothetical protein LCGC14_0650280 [marine sediment metagenome]|uniref:Uncharacterized protein n=1 Tax=marine sediment metagenome TaxID=412755 RepID=A0A0F9R1T8_9ZZZZ
MGMPDPKVRCFKCDIQVWEANVDQFDRCPNCDNSLCSYCWEKEHIVDDCYRCNTPDSKEKVLPNTYNGVW